MPPVISQPLSTSARLANPSSTTTVDKGDIRVFGEVLVAQATEAIAGGATGNWMVPPWEGVNKTVSSTTGSGGVVGDFAYVLTATENITTVATSNTQVGVFMSVAAAGATAVIKLTDQAS